MSSPVAGPLRLLRAAMLATVTVALGAVAHLLGGGALPPWPALAAIVALAFGPAVVATGRRLGRGAVLALLGVGQLGLHGAFALLGGAVCVVPGRAAGPHAGHGVVGASAQLAALVGSVGSVGSGGAGVAGPGCTPPVVHLALDAPSMLALHVTATVVTGLLLAGGERALSWLVAWLRPLVEVPVAVVAPVAGVLVVPAERGGPSTRLPRAPWTLRGPPEGLTATA